MGSATTILFARADLSIPKATVSSRPSAGHADNVQNRFFKLVVDSEPDIIVLDFSSVPPSGTDTILSIRRRCAVPILVVCEPGDPMTEEYRIAGAAGCIFAPIDILSLHRSVERVLRVTGRAMSLENEQEKIISARGANSRRQRKPPAATARPAPPLRERTSPEPVRFVRVPPTL